MHCAPEAPVAECAMERPGPLRECTVPRRFRPPGGGVKTTVVQAPAVVLRMCGGRRCAAPPETGPPRAARHHARMSLSNSSWSNTIVVLQNSQVICRA